jgi:hypothetical protein
MQNVNALHCGTATPGCPPVILPCPKPTTGQPGVAVPQFVQILELTCRRAGIHQGVVSLRGIGCIEIRTTLYVWEDS